MASEFDPDRVLRTLNDHGVRFVVIGGLATVLLGAPIVTNDVDICYERTDDNIDRLAQALKELEATLRVAGVDEELPFILDGHTLAAGDSFTFNTNAGPLDILGTPSGTSGFRDLFAHSAEYDLGNGLLVRIADIEDVIRMKEAAGRAKDEAHLHQLAILREMLDEAGRGDRP